MVRLAVLGDVHGHDRLGAERRGRPDRLGPALELLAARGPHDLAIQVGDVALDPGRLPEGYERDLHDASVSGVLEDLGEAVGAPVLFVPGNHDLPDPPEVEGAANVDGRVVESAGLRVAGLGGAGPHLFGFPYEWTDEEREPAVRELADRAGSVDVLVPHAPPAGVLDRTAHGERVGSGAVGQAVRLLEPSLVLCGHIHEAAGVARLETGAVCLNAGSLGAPYGRVIAWVVEVDGKGSPTRILRLEPGETREVPVPRTRGRG